jgi:CheY-like chemotaxis protein
MDPQPRPRVLIVDDAELNVSILVQSLRPEYHLDVATSGAKALEAIAACRPDLVLLDILMPEMDGYEVCRQLKASAPTRDLPIIFLTALDEAEEKSRGFRLGAVDYITKPFDIVEVQARVRTHLEIARYKRELERQNRELREARLRLQHQVNELEGRDQLVRAQMWAITAPAACEVILDVLRRVLGCTDAAVYLPDKSNRWLQTCGRHAGAVLLPAVDCAAPGSLLALACRQLEPRSDASGEVAVPLLFRQRTLGVLWVKDMPALQDRELALHTLWRLASEGTLALRAACLAEEIENGEFGAATLLDPG